MSTRRRLPNRRESEIAEFDLGGVSYVASASFFADGRLAEIFLDGPKIGSSAQISAREGAVLASLALQHGVGARDLHHALEKLDDGSPAGPIGRALECFEARAQ